MNENIFELNKKVLEKFRNLSVISETELAFRERLKMEQRLSELSLGIAEHFRLNAIVTNSAHTSFLKESQAFEQLEKQNSAIAGIQQLQQYQQWTKYIEKSIKMTFAGNDSLAEMLSLGSQYDSIKQFHEKMVRAYTFPEHLASITRATEAIYNNFYAIHNAPNLNNYLALVAGRPSIELQFFIIKSNNLVKRRHKDFLQIDAINASVELASSESIESTNLVLSASDLIGTGDGESNDLFKSLPTFNLYYFQRKDILLLARQNPSHFQKTEDIDNLPSNSYHKIANSCCQIITKCNEKCGASGKEYIFKPTNKLLKAFSAIPELITHNESTFGEFIDCLFILLYEGAGDDKLRLRDYLTDNELRPLWDIKKLRNYLRHDIEHRDNKEAKHKMQKVGDIFSGLIAKRLPENSQDYRKAQTEIINNILIMLKSLFNKINNLCN